MPHPQHCTLVRKQIPLGENISLQKVLMQSLPITAFGHGQITVDASSLTAGMYIYSLVVDGQIVDSKRMILTE